MSGLFVFGVDRLRPFDRLRERSRLSFFAIAVKERFVSMTVSFSQLGKMGRLGNQLFQIAATIAIAKEHGQDFIFPEWPYEKYFRHKLPKIQSGERERKSEAVVVSEGSFNYKKIRIDRGRDVDLQGYFQSEKYFAGYREEVLKYFEWENEFLIQMYLRLVKLAEMDDVDTCLPAAKCAVHIRRGDYVGNSGYHQLDLTYYTDAMRQIPGGVNFIFFSDDIKWVKQHFFGKGIYYAEGNTEIEDLCMMSLCQYHIVANSSFSWWGAYLKSGERERKSEVYTPNKWFGPALENTHDDKDIVPEGWHKWPFDSCDPAQGERKKIDLRDVTFTIPVKIEHKDREENLKLCVDYLNYHFDTNIIIGYAEKMLPEGAPFHRTKLLNMMAIEAKTPYVANWDADILIHPLQIWMAVRALRNGDVAGIYPYDGTFHRLDRKHLGDLQGCLNVDFVQGFKFPKHEYEQKSVGGAIIWNKKEFLAGGGENENFISYGPEDMERFERFVKLGYRVVRVRGPLYHVNHYTGPDSSADNPAFKANEAECQKVKAMSGDELRQYVDGWPWKELYDEAFLEDIDESARVSAKIILKELRSGIAPYYGLNSLLDVGCGSGAWNVLEADEEYVGVDNHNHLQEGWIKQHVGEPFDLRRKFDLVICMEVGEHLPEECADTLVDNLVRHGDRILFSAAIPGQNGRGHINEQWQSWWAKKFHDRGYFINAMVFRAQFWANEAIPYYYRQNMFLAYKGPSGAIAYSWDDMIDVVHPDKWKVQLEAGK